MKDVSSRDELSEEVLAVIAAAVAAAVTAELPPVKPGPALATRKDAELYAQMARQLLMSKRRRGGRA